MTLAIPFVLAAAQAVLANEHAKQDIAPRERYLLLDQLLISSVDNAVLNLGTVKKHPGNPVFKDELPWEAEGSHMYTSVVFDPEERIYKCWYYSHWWRKNEKFKETREEVKPGPQAVMEGNDRLALLYATSSDGIRWVKKDWRLQPVTLRWPAPPSETSAVGPRLWQRPDCQRSTSSRHPRRRVQESRRYERTPRSRKRHSRMLRRDVIREIVKRDRRMTARFSPRHKGTSEVAMTR